MHVANVSDVTFEEFTERGAIHTRRKTLVSDRNGAKLFRLRFYSVEPNGQTPYDIHEYEHVVIVINGKGAVLSKDEGAPKLINIKKGDVVYISSNEPHQFINTGQEPLEFYCFSTAAHLYHKHQP